MDFLKVPGFFSGLLFNMNSKISRTEKNSHVPARQAW
jgi:hypothetical protein